MEYCRVRVLKVSAIVRLTDDHAALSVSDHEPILLLLRDMIVHAQTPDALRRPVVTLGSKASRDIHGTRTHTDVICLVSLALECATFTLTMVSIRQFHVYSNWREHSPIVRVICRDGKRSLLIELLSIAHGWLRGYIFSCRSI